MILKTTSKFCTATLCLASSLIAADKPNILFIAIDDLKPTIGAYSESVPTPAMDRIAAQGTTFLNAHCQQAVCGPSRASIMTGKYRILPRSGISKPKFAPATPDILTLTEHFKKNGYYALGMGKIYDPRSVDKGCDTRSWSKPYTQTWHLDYNPTTGKPTGHYHNAKSKQIAAELGNSNWNTLNKKLFKNNAWPVVEAEAVPDDAYDDGAIAAHAVNSSPYLHKKNNPSSSL